jgi:NADH dehydrogenase
MKKRVVIVGGGFGGCFTAKRLETMLSRTSDIEVALVNRDNYFIFQPLLPEVASGAIVPHQIVNPIRRMLPRTRFYASELLGIALERREVTILLGDGKRSHVLVYDHLVIALGTVLDLSRLPGMNEHALPMRTVADAFYLRNHVIGCLERADIEPDPEYKRSLLTFVVVGGGFSGVETVGELQEMVDNVLPSYPNLTRAEIRFVLVQGADRILPEVVPSLAMYAAKRLTSRGVEMFLNARCKAATAHGVVLEGDRKIATQTLVATIGNGPHPLLAKLPCPREKGRIVADATLAVPGFPGVWALGDCAAITHEHEGMLYAPTAQNAIRQAARCAANIVAELRGEAPQKFHFDALGKLASLGGRSAVAELLGVRISGFLAWFIWRTLYLLKLPGWERRLRVALDWTLDLVFRRDLTQLKVFRRDRVAQAHYEPGEAIVKQGEIGDRFYVVVKGQAEVVLEGADGSEKRVAALGPGHHFGEVALLADVRRTATVRAAEPTDVLFVERGDFANLSQTMALLKAGLPDRPANAPALSPHGRSLESQDQSPQGPPQNPHD